MGIQRSEPNNKDKAHNKIESEVIFMKKIMKGKKSNIMAIAMCLLKVSGIFLHTMAPKATDVDGKYQVIYDKFEQMDREPPMTPSEVYDKYGDMNGDYYIIAMEENLLYLTGNTDVRAKDLIVINDNLKKSGALPLDLRRSLREDVETYGLDCKLPDDPGFSYSGTEMPTHSEPPAPVATETPTPTPVPTGVTTPTTITFADVTPDAWYYDAVETLAQSGFLKGYDDGLFHPDDELTIGQWCAIVWRIVGGNIGAADGATVTQGGVNVTAPHWAAAAVNSCRTYHFTKFGPTFDPDYVGHSNEDLITERGEAVTAVMRIVQETNLESTLSNRANEQGFRNWIKEDIPDWDVVEQNVEPSGFADMEGTRYGETHWWNPDSILKAYNYGIIQGVDSIGTCNPRGVLTRAQACQMLYNAMITSPRPIQGHGGIM